jgi:hypothetical protein
MKMISSKSRRSCAVSRTDFPPAFHLAEMPGLTPGHFLWIVDFFQCVTLILIQRNKPKETVIWNDGPLQLCSQSGLMGQHCDSTSLAYRLDRLAMCCVAVRLYVLRRLKTRSSGPLERFGGNAT